METFSPFCYFVFCYWNLFSRPATQYSGNDFIECDPASYPKVHITCFYFDIYSISIVCHCIFSINILIQKKCRSIFFKQKEKGCFLAFFHYSLFFINYCFHNSQWFLCPNFFCHILFCCFKHHYFGGPCLCNYGIAESRSKVLFLLFSQ